MKKILDREPDIVSAAKEAYRLDTRTTGEFKEASFEIFKGLTMTVKEGEKQGVTLQRNDQRLERTSAEYLSILKHVSLSIEWLQDCRILSEREKREHEITAELVQLYGSLDIFFQKHDTKLLTVTSSVGTIGIKKNYNSLKLQHLLEDFEFTFYSPKNGWNPISLKNKESVVKLSYWIKVMIDKISSPYRAEVRINRSGQKVVQLDFRED